MKLVARPTPLEILTGVQQALTENVMPELRTDDARAQLGNAIGLLSYLASEFDDAADSLSNEIDEVRNALLTVIPPLRAAENDNLASRLQSAVDSEPPDIRVSSLLARLDELQETLLETLLYLEPNTEGDGESLIAARDTLREALVALNRRQGQ